MSHKNAIYILGAGGIGLLHASHLSSCRPILILRPDTLARFRKHENQIQFRGQYMYFDATSEDEILSSKSQIQHLIVSTKAYDVLPALKPLIPALSQSTSRSSILFLQNGALGVYDQVKQILSPGDRPEPNLFLGSTTHGAFLDTSSFTLSQRGVGKTIFGSINITDKGAANEFSSLLLNNWKGLNATRVSKEILLDELFLKLAVNCCINPTLALLDSKNGVAVASTRTKDFIRHLVAELYPVLKEHISVSEPELYTQVLDVAEKTAANENSMLVDLKRGNRTEIDYLTGYLLNLARRTDLRCPTHHTLYHLIQMKQDILDSRL